MFAQLEWFVQYLLQERCDLACSVDRSVVEQQQRELIAAPARQHAFVASGGALKPGCRLHEQFIARRVPQRVVDQFESIDIDEHHDHARTSTRANIAQYPIELVHEIAPVRQPRECVVIARVLEAALEILALLDLGGELAICCLRLSTRQRERLAGTVQVVYQIMRGECDEPGHDGQQRNG